MDKHVKYLQRHCGSKTVVVFDGYSDYTKNIKAMEQLRRTAAFSKSYEVCFDETMIVPISQDKVLSNQYNKKKLIDMLIEKLKSINITTEQARDDADVLIIETAIEVSKHERTVVIIGEDIDLLVILIGRTQLHQEEISFTKLLSWSTTFFKDYAQPLRYKSIRPGRSKNDPTVMDIKVIALQSRWPDQSKIRFRWRLCDAA